MEKTSFDNGRGHQMKKIKILKSHFYDLELVVKLSSNLRCFFYVEMFHIAHETLKSA